MCFFIRMFDAYVMKTWILRPRFSDSFRCCSSIFSRSKYHRSEILSLLLRWRQDWKWAKALSVDGCANRVRRLRKSYSRCKRSINERKSRVTAKRSALFERARLFVNFDFSRYSLYCFINPLMCSSRCPANALQIYYLCALPKLYKNLRSTLANSGADWNNLTFEFEFLNSFLQINKRICCVRMYVCVYLCR